MDNNSNRNGAAGFPGAEGIVERKARSCNGFPVMFGAIAVFLLSIPVLVASIQSLAAFYDDSVDAAAWIAPPAAAIGAFVAAALCLVLAVPIALSGLRVLKPQEAYVLTLFGKYAGTLKGPGFFFVNPFSAAVPVGAKAATSGELTAKPADASVASASKAFAGAFASKKMSLKALTLNNDKQKVNDLLGNPVVIGIVVIWRVVDTAKAAFCVDDYYEFLSIQADAALRNIVRLYPYDLAGGDDANEQSLRGSSQEIAGRLQAEIQSKVAFAGLEIMEARITHLSYAPEIAAAMLQRQQASAIVDARQMIVDGAVGMVEMALTKLNERGVVQLDEERKAAMVSNLLVVLCGNRDAQPVVNSGTLY
jgi:regulator of protease activity HflC (stomatin/prohibitin superfamily)